MSLCNAGIALLTRLEENRQDFVDENPPTSYNPHELLDTNLNLPQTLHPSWTLFGSSIESKCPICWAIWRELRSSPADSWCDKSPQRFHIWVSILERENPDFQGTLSLCIKSYGLTRVGGLTILDVRRVTKEAFDIQYRPRLANHVFSDESFDTIRRWWQQCQDDHYQCTKRPNAKFAPSRLLKIHDGMSRAWSIIETKADNRLYQYAALSHRWSDDIPVLKSSDNIYRERKRYDSDLPPHFQDVLTICRKLCIQYIWIDSMCIIQDSNEDWKRESATMMDVYTNAILTLSICWKQQGLGVFLPRDPCTLPFWPTGCVEEVQSQASQKTHAFVRVPGEWTKAINKAPVNERGWVLQERLLSHQILYLGNEQLYYECDQLLASECAPNSSPCLWHWFRRKNVHGDQHQLLKTWPGLIRDYTFMDLTKEEDRLVAFSGIAELLCKRHNQDYVAGLRRQFWIYDLCWSPVWVAEERCPAKGLPSWSWASFPGPISWNVCAPPSLIDDSTFNPLAKLCTLDAEFNGGSVYGTPISATMDILSLLIPALYRRSVPPRTWERVLDRENLDWILIESSSFLISDENSENAHEDSSTIAIPFRTTANLRPTCFVLPLLHENGSYPDDGRQLFSDIEFPVIHALIVQEQSSIRNDGRRTFSHMGSLFIDNNSELKNLYRGTLNGIANELVSREGGRDRAPLTEDNSTFEEKLLTFLQKPGCDPVPTNTEMEDVSPEDIAVQGKWSTICLI